MDAYSEVFILARIQPTLVSDDGKLVEGPGVKVLPLPYYHGIKGAIVTLPRLWRALGQHLEDSSIVIGRLVEPISTLMYFQSRRLRRRFVSFVVIEPEEFLRSAVPGPLGRAIGRFAHHLTRHIVRHSCGVVYVSRQWLQERYPASINTPTLSRSNVMLSQDSFSGSARTLNIGPASPINLVSVGSLESTRKGFGFLLRVVAELVNNGLNAKLLIVGSGSTLGQLSKMSERLGLANRVTFAGEVHEREQLTAILDAADIYVSGSKAEGLPRATIEAMARGLPVVSTRAGAVSELLPDSCLTEVGDVPSFVEIIQAIIHDPHSYSSQSEANIEAASQVVAQAGYQQFSAFLKTLGASPEPP